MPPRRRLDGRHQPAATHRSTVAPPPLQELGKDVTKPFEHLAREWHKAHEAELARVATM